MRLIDADALLENLDDCPLDYGRLEYSAVLTEVKYSPTIDAVEVVRCKDCVESFARAGKKPIGCYRHGKNGITLHDPDDYCSQGKRREPEGR